MSQLTCILIAAIGLLTALVVVAIVQLYRLKQKKRAVEGSGKRVASRTDGRFLGGRFLKLRATKDIPASRARDIAIIAQSSKNSETIDTIAEFTETMRENGAYLYHFTNYWTNNDSKDPQRIVSDALQKNYHGIFVLGIGLTKMVKNIGLTHNRLTPTVFAHIHDETWQKEQEKRMVTHMTGVVASDGWAQRVRLYLTIKPFMRSALIPVTSPAYYEWAKRIGDLLESYGVSTHMVRIHGHNDFLSTLSDHAYRVDSLIRLFDAYSPETTQAVAKKCSEFNITFFSPFLKDISHGVAVAIGNSNERSGYFAAQKMLAIIEEHQAPATIPVLNISDQQPYEIHFNQMAMQIQGMDPSRITTLALQYASKVTATLDKDVDIS